MKLTLRVWRQKNSNTQGKLEDHQLDDVSPDSSFLEMIDDLNEKLTNEGNEPIAFDHDCREGICGMCSLVVNGVAHGQDRELIKAVTICQLHMRNFKGGETIVLEPWRAEGFPLLKDLIVDRGAFDRIIQAGGFISVGTGSAPDANALPIPKKNADISMDAAACIGCGACVAACPNASAMLFTSAKMGSLNHLPQGQTERYQRVVNMVTQMDNEGFGACTNMAECEAACPKEISLDFIAQMNRDLITATLKGIGPTV
ncbi:succinate dehydrogenase/fumarate reductase iron-sulfur subunit [Anaerolineales bacterium HSG6]|nr:succinate dehydrogenase/fumarate reductase iron-sulfur subunit [Anaerolineales bacterium HSG6]MDM8530795.1 succinate dehydrogenase/fumarate reductase iron-sulfur subunit [Anaerolineales bacterium HSG25]